MGCEMKSRYVFLLAVLILAVSSINATEVNLIKIIRSDNQEKVQLKIGIDGDNSLKYLKIISITKTQKFDLEKIRSSDGATALTKNGIDVVRLKSNDIDKVLGGYVQLIYLKKFNVFKSNKYETVTLRALKSGKGIWKLFYKGKSIKNITVVPYRWGIKRVIIQ